MKKLILVMLIWGGGLSAQVTTQSFQKGKVFENIPALNLSKDKSSLKNMPLFDIAPLLKEDELVKGLDVPFRFGKSFDVRIINRKVSRKKIVLPAG